MRLAPLPADQWDDAVDEALAVMLPKERRTPDKASNILSTFVHHPALLKEFLKFNVHLLFRSTLPPRERELAILRVAHRTDSEYEWFQHVRMGKNEGLTEQEAFARLRKASQVSGRPMKVVAEAVVATFERLE